MPSVNRADSDLRPWSRGDSQRISPLHHAQGKDRKSPSFLAQGSASPYGTQQNGPSSLSSASGSKVVGTASTSRAGGKGSSQRKQRGGSSRTSPGVSRLAHGGGSIGLAISTGKDAQSVRRREAKEKLIQVEEHVDEIVEDALRTHIMQKNVKSAERRKSMKEHRKTRIMSYRPQQNIPGDMGTLSERRIASGPVIFGPLGPIPVGKKPSTRERMAFISKSSLGSMVTFDHEIRRGDGDMEKEQKEEMKEGEEGERKDDADDGRASKTPSKSQRLPELNEAADDNEANPFYVAGQVKPQTPMSAPKPVWTPEMSRSRRHRTRSKKTPSSAQPALGVGRSVSPGFARAGGKSPLPSSWQGKVIAEPSFSDSKFGDAATPSALAEELKGKINVAVPLKQGDAESKEEDRQAAVEQPSTAHVEAQSSISSNTTEVLESGLQDAMQALGMLTTSSLGGGQFESSAGAGTDGQVEIGYKTKQGIMVITERDLPDYELLVPEDPKSLSHLGGRDIDGGGGGRGRAGGRAGMLSSHASPIHIRKLNGAMDYGKKVNARLGGEKPAGMDWDRASLRSLLRHSDEKARGKFKGGGGKKGIAASEGLMQKQRVWRGRPHKK